MVPRFIVLALWLLVALALVGVTPSSAATTPSTVAPSTSPTARPTVSFRPTRKPTRSPTYRPKANSIYTDYAPTETLTADQQQGIVIGLIALLVLLMAFEISTPEVLFLVALCILVLTEILTLSQALSGFSNSAVLTIGSLFLVIGAVEKSHIVDWVGRKAFGATGSENLGKFRMYCTTFSLSCFLNNTPLVALFMPIVKDWGRMRGIGASQLLLPLNYAILAGSFGSMIGTSSNLTIQGIMEADRGYSFSFFAPFPIGIVCFLALALYMIVAAPVLLPKHKTGLLREARDSAKKLIAEVYVSGDSLMVGKTVEVFATSLGIQVSSVIKIRRAVHPGQPANDIEAHKPVRSQEIVDPSYRKRVASFWQRKSERRASAGGAEEPKVDFSAPEDSEVAYTDIIAPARHELIGAGDIVFFSSARQVVEKMMKSILGESKGLRVLQSDVMALPGFGTELVECVISDKNPFLGKTVQDMAQEFSQHYQAGLITVRGKEWGTMMATESTPPPLSPQAPSDGALSPSKGLTSPPASSASYALALSEEGRDDLSEEREDNSSDTSPAQIEMVDRNSPLGSETSSEKRDEALEASLIPSSHPQLDIPSVSEHVLVVGDVILCVTNEPNVSELSSSKDFFVVSSVGALPKPLTLWGIIPVVGFLAMLIIAANELVDICPLSMTLAAVLFLGGWLSPKDIPKYIDVRLLMLLGTSLSFAISMTSSGLAMRIASGISAVEPTPFSALLLTYAITLVITEIISNNAAGALMYPIGVALADELGVSFKPFAMAVMIACTAGFMCPIGYQTHVMVWGPGGYLFRDFLVFGLVPNLIYWLLGCAMTTLVFPF